MKLDDHLIPRFHHSTVVVDIPTLGGAVAFLLWGYGEDYFPLSLAQMLLIDFQKCKRVIEIFSYDILRWQSLFDRCQYQMSQFQQGSNQSALLLEEVFSLFCDMEVRPINWARTDQRRY